MGLEDPDLVDDGDTGGGGKSVSCSICLEVVTDGGDRSSAKLQCGHRFHLDCIGSAFNVKGVMQCPNCRKIEKGQWLFANGSRSYSEFSMEEWAHDDDLYDLGYPIPGTNSMWCPFGGFTRLPASLDEGDFPTTAYHDFLGQHTIITEHATALSSATHLCPYVAYVQPVHPSSASGATVADSPTYNNNNTNQWNSSQSASSERPSSYGLSHMNIRHHTPPFPPSNNGADQLAMPSVTPRRPVRNNADWSRSGSYLHPLILGQSSVAARVPISVGSSLTHPHLGSAARARERNQALQAYFQQPSSLPVVSGSRRSNNPGQMGQVGPSSDIIRGSGGGVYYLPTSGSSTRSGFQEAESSMPNPFHHVWEREPHPHPGQGWGYHQGGAATRLRHGSERGPSQGHSNP